MQIKRYTWLFVFVLMVLFAAACNKSAGTGNQGINKFNNRNVSPGKSLYWELSWDDRERKIVDFLNLDNLELTVQIKNMDDEKQSVVFEETITVIP